MAHQVPRNSTRGALFAQTLRQTSELPWEEGYITTDTKLEDEFFGRRALSISDLDGSRNIDSPVGKLNHGDNLFRFDDAATCFSDHEDFQHISTNTALTSCSSTSALDSFSSNATDDPLLLQCSTYRVSSIPQVMESSACCSIGAHPTGAEEKLDDEQIYDRVAREELSNGLRYPFSRDATLKNVAAAEAWPVTRSCITERAFAPSKCGEILEPSSPKSTHGSADSPTDFDDARPKFDASPASMHFFSQAGVHVTTRELQNDFPAAQATSLGGGYLEIDQDIEDEKNRVISAFFANQHHDTTSASIRPALIGTNNTIQDIKPYEKQQSVRCSFNSPFNMADIDGLVDEDYYLGPVVVGPDNLYNDGLTNMTTGDYHARTTAHQDAAQLTRSPQTGASVMTAFESASPTSLVLACHSKPEVRADNCLTTAQPTQARNSMVELPDKQQLKYTGERFNKVIVRTSKASIVTEHGSILKKRKLPSYAESHEHRTKCIRSVFHLKHSVEIDASVRDPSPTSSVSTGLLKSPMATALRGYAGQFPMYASNKFLLLKHSTHSHTFGNRAHPNGLITNRSFTLDVCHNKKDFTDFTINDDTELGMIVSHAEQSSFASSLLKSIRTQGENALRQEAHRECAVARLEGVSVGYYRYFLGHMTAEEYIGAKLCVCWEECYCNKLCTRFGDLMCPCSDKLVIEQEE